MKNVFFALALMGSFKAYSAPGSSQAEEKTLDFKREVVVCNFQKLESMLTPYLDWAEKEGKLSQATLLEKKLMKSAEGNKNAQKPDFDWKKFSATRIVLDLSVVKKILSIEQEASDTQKTKAEKKDPFQRIVGNAPFWKKLSEEGVEIQARIEANLPLEQASRALEFFPKDLIQTILYGSLDLRPVLLYKKTDEVAQRLLTSKRYPLPKEFPVTTDVVCCKTVIGEDVISFLEKNNKNIIFLRFQECMMYKPFSLSNFTDLRFLCLGFYKDWYLESFDKIVPAHILRKLELLKIESADQSLDLYEPHEPIFLGNKEDVGTDVDSSFSLNRLEISIPYYAYYTSLKLGTFPHLRSLTISYFDHKLEENSKKDFADEKIQATFKNPHALTTARFPVLEKLHLGYGVRFSSFPAGAFDFNKIQELSFYEGESFFERNIDLKKFPNLKRLSCCLNFWVSDQFLQHPHIEYLRILDPFSAWPKDADLPSLQEVDLRPMPYHSYKGDYYSKRKERYTDIERENDFPEKWLPNFSVIVKILEAQKTQKLSILCEPVSEDSTFYKELSAYYKKRKSQGDGTFWVNNNTSYCRIVFEKKEVQKNKADKPDLCAEELLLKKTKIDIE